MLKNMDSFIVFILDSLRSFFDDNIILLVFYISIFVVFFWLYKEFRIKLLEEEKLRREKESDILKEFVELEFELKLFCSDKANFDIVKKKLARLYPYLSYQLSKKVSDFSLEMESRDILNFIEELRKERNVIKYDQLNEFSYKNARNLSNILGYQFRFYFSSLIKPLLLAIFSLIILLVFVLISIGYAEIDSWKEKYFITQELINICIFLVLLIGILDNIMEKKIMNEKSTWIYIIFFILSSLVNFLFVKYCKIISTAVFIVYIYLIIKLPKIIKN